jgi:hypothetical protein
MQKFFSYTFQYGLILLAFLTLCILGAEPSGTGEEALSNYETSIEFWAPIILIGWCGSLVLVIVSGIVLHRLDQK